MLRGQDCGLKRPLVYGSASAVRQRGHERSLACSSDPNPAPAAGRRKEQAMHGFNRLLWLIVLLLVMAGTLGGLFLWPALSRIFTH